MKICHNDKWRYLILGIFIGLILGGLLTYFVTRNPDSRSLIRIPSMQPASGDQLSIEPTRGNEGKINLNTSDVDELATLPGIGTVKAQSIVEFREKYGDFENIDELLYVTGFGKTLLSEIFDLVYIE